MQNQRFIKEYGITKFMEQQNSRIDLLKRMLNHYDDGNCKSYYCLAATLLSLKGLDEALVKAEQEIKQKSVSEGDLKSKAKILKEILKQVASDEDEELKLRKVQK